MPSLAVTIYSTPSCIYCKLAKQFFAENNISFTEIDVAEDSLAAQKMIKLSGQSGVPVIDVGGKIIVGFDKPALKKLLHLS